jgi:phosphohistidine phosphatase
LRHAKSDWSASPGKDASDHERPLAARGREAAPRMGAYMRRKVYEPCLVLCSTARRTKETVELLLPALQSAPKLRYKRELYLADWPVLLNEIHKSPPSASPLLIVGHNPGLEQLALALALHPRNAAERARAQRLAQKFPTGALAVLDFDGESWRAAKPGTGHLVDYVRPKDLGMDGDGS